MKKVAIILIISLLGGLIGCGNDSKDINNKDVKEPVKKSSIIEGDLQGNASQGSDEEETLSETNIKDLNGENIESKKQIYFDKYTNLEDTLKVELEDKYSTGITLDLREATAIEYKNWDDLLNEIYGVLNEQLSPDEMESVKEEQINWLDIRDTKAEESANEVKGGSLEPVFYTSSLAESTKSRCYELIRKYMK